MRNTVRALIGSLIAGLLLATATGPAWPAQQQRNYDRVVPDVEVPSGQPVPIDIKVNGGTPGTIQLWYTVTASTFPVGEFAQFTLKLSIEGGTLGDTTYPATLTLYQTGLQNLVLTPAQTEFSPNVADRNASFCPQTFASVRLPHQTR